MAEERAGVIVVSGNTVSDLVSYQVVEPFAAAVKSVPVPCRGSIDTTAIGSDID